MNVYHEYRINRSIMNLFLHLLYTIMVFSLIPITQNILIFLFLKTNTINSIKNILLQSFILIISDTFIIVLSLSVNNLNKYMNNRYVLLGFHLIITTIYIVQSYQCVYINTTKNIIYTLIMAFISLFIFSFIIEITYNNDNCIGKAFDYNYKIFLIKKEYLQKYWHISTNNQLCFRCENGLEFKITNDNYQINELEIVDTIDKNMIYEIIEEIYKWFTSKKTQSTNSQKIQLVAIFEENNFLLDESIDKIQQYIDNPANKKNVFITE